MNKGKKKLIFLLVAIIKFYFLILLLLRWYFVLVIRSFFLVRSCDGLVLAAVCGIVFFLFSFFDPRHLRWMTTFVPVASVLRYFGKYWFEMH